MRLLLTSFLLLAFFLLAGCDNDDQLLRSQEILGYTVLIQTNPVADKDILQKNIDKAFNVVRARLSIFNGDDCELMKLNTERSSLKVSDDFYQFLQIASELQSRTESYWNPQFGALYELWLMRSDEPLAPSADSIRVALENAEQTTIVLHDNSTVSLSGAGSFDPGRVAVAWALDGGADFLIRAGVRAGEMEIDKMYRFWGKPEVKDAWNFEIASPVADSIRYIIEPEIGSVVIQSRQTHGFDYYDQLHHKILSPENGLPVLEPFGVVVWAGTAAQSAAIAEATILMGRNDAFKWVSEQKNTAIFYIYNTNMGYIAESDPKMAGWVRTKAL